MKKLILTAIGTLTIVFTQAQCQAHLGYGQNGAIISFTDSSTTQSTNYSATWLWDFGDGNTSTQQNPTHTYSNGTYNVCLTITFLDLVSMNTCVSTYCESIFIGNTPSASWDCDPVSGCYDPGTGNGQYTTLVACQTVCSPPSWDCDPVSGCYDPGTGLGQYTSFIHCDTTCGSVNTPSSWDCDPVSGCYDPGTGNGQYTTLASCQSNCSSTVPTYCDFMIATGSQSTFIVEISNNNTIIEHWLTTAPNGDTLQYDNMTNMHAINTVGMLYNTITTCITYIDGGVYYTCCETFIFNGTSWARMGSSTSITESSLFNKKLIKIVDLFGREAKVSKNEPLFYVYEDGTVEKKIIIE